ncbi:hypothetical protein BDW22DRAFT_1358274 [Trametopsis cervina]|nr:hypothetical protein BDW22DRAFT_1358274 [Trametopsis cervina]
MPQCRGSNRRFSQDRHLTQHLKTCPKALALSRWGYERALWIQAQQEANQPPHKRVRIESKTDDGTADHTTSNPTESIADSSNHATQSGNPPLSDLSFTDGVLALPRSTIPEPDPISLPITIRSGRPLRSTGKVCDQLPEGPGAVDESDTAIAKRPLSPQHSVESDSA